MRPVIEKCLLCSEVLCLACIPSSWNWQGNLVYGSAPVVNVSGVQLFLFIKYLPCGGKDVNSARPYDLPLSILPPQLRNT